MAFKSEIDLGNLPAGSVNVRERTRSRLARDGECQSWVEHQVVIGTKVVGRFDTQQEARDMQSRIFVARLQHRTQPET